jgi:hypothetical protein
VFAALTLHWQWHDAGVTLAFPFVVFALLALAAIGVLRLPGTGITPSKKAESAILWSTIGEGVGLFLATNIVINLHRPDLLLPAMALVVGSHFLPIAFADAFRPFYILGAVLIGFAIVGFAVSPPTGGAIAGFAAAASLWIAASLAVHRDWQAKRSLAFGA